MLLKWVLNIGPGTEDPKISIHFYDHFMVITEFEKSSIFKIVIAIEIDFKK